MTPYMLTLNPFERSAYADLRDESPTILSSQKS